MLKCVLIKVYSGYPFFGMTLARESPNRTFEILIRGLAIQTVTAT